MCPRACARARGFVHAYAHTHIHTHTHTHVHIHTYRYTQTNTHMHACMHAHTCINNFVCMYLCRSALNPTTPSVPSPASTARSMQAPTRTQEHPTTHKSITRLCQANMASSPQARVGTQLTEVVMMMFITIYVVLWYSTLRPACLDVYVACSGACTGPVWTPGRPRHLHSCMRASGMQGTCLDAWPPSGVVVASE